MSNALISITWEISDYLLIASVVAAILVTAAGGVIKPGKIKAPVHRHLIRLIEFEEALSILLMAKLLFR